MVWMCVMMILMMTVSELFWVKLRDNKRMIIPPTRMMVMTRTIHPTMDCLGQTTKLILGKTKQGGEGRAGGRARGENGRAHTSTNSSFFGVSRCAHLAQATLIASAAWYASVATLHTATRLYARRKEVISHSPVPIVSSLTCTSRFSPLFSHTQPDCQQ